MKIVLIGATGTIGSAVGRALTARHHAVIPVRRSEGEYRADIANKRSLRRLFKTLAPFDAVIVTAGEAAFAPMEKLDDKGFKLSLSSKLMGQVNAVRVALPFISDKGSFTLTSGILAQQPMVGSAAISLVNAGLEGFVRAAALEMPRGVRINVVSPPWIRETLIALKMDPAPGWPASQIAPSYVESVEGKRNGEVIDAREFAGSPLRAAP